MKLILTIKLSYIEQFSLILGQRNSELLLDKLGIFWSWNVKEAFPYYSLKKSKYYYIYKAKVDISDINWGNSIIKSLDYYKGEQELELFPNSNVEVVEIIERHLEYRYDKYSGNSNNFKINFVTKA